MSPDLSTARIYTDFQGFSDLKTSARNNSPEALKEVATQFEALFLQMMLKSMRDAALSDGIFDSDQSKLYMGLFDQQIAIDLASKQSFGIAEMLTAQLGQQSDPFRSGISVREITAPGDNSRSGNTEKTQVNNTYREDGGFKDPEEFISFMRPLAEDAAGKLGIKAEVLIAQAALETGWGKRVIKDNNGASSFNLFGIKSGSRWDGPEVNVSSLEYEDGNARKIVSAFRVYESYQHSFNDYVDFIRENANYRDALINSKDHRDYIYGIHAAGYATDPKYPDKIIDILERNVI